MNPIEKIENRLEAVSFDDESGRCVLMCDVKQILSEEAKAYESVKGDSISREKAIETIWNLFNSWGNNAVRFSEDETRLINMAFAMAQKEIEKLPPAYNEMIEKCEEEQEYCER